MPSRAPVMRLFVAVYPPRDVATAMLGLLDGLALPEHRTTPVEQVHMTLQFIGDRRERELEAVIESVSRSAAGIGPVTLRPTRLVSLPEQGAARLVAVTTDGPSGLLEIQRRLAKRLADPKRRPRRFTPHLTVCRFGDEERMDRIDIPIEVEPFAVGEIRLMRSVLHVTGPEHRVVKQVTLEGR